MLKAKKGITMVLVFLLGLSIIGALNVAAEGEGIQLLAKFDSAEAINRVNAVQRMDETNGLATEHDIVLSGSVSAKLVFNTLGGSILFPSGESAYPADIKDYSAINMWVYAPQTYTSTVKISARSPRTTVNNQFVYDLPIDFTGWKQVTIPFSAFIASNSPNWSNIEGIRIEKGNTFSEAENVTIYIDRIWLTGDGRVDNTFTIADYSVPGAATRINATSDIAVKRAYDLSAKWNLSTFITTARCYYANRGEVPSDWTAYNYLNFWIYSPQVQDALFNVVTWTSGGTTYRFRYPITLDFTGWKLLSIPLADMTNNTNYNNGADWTNVNYLTLNGTSWTNGGADQSTASVNLEKIWLSKEAPVEAEAVGTTLVGTNPQQGAENVSVDNKNIIISYSKPLASVCKAEGVSVNDAAKNYFVGSYGKDMHVIFYNGLEADRSYEVSVNGSVYTANGAAMRDTAETSFATEPAIFSVSRPTISNENEVLKASATVKNTLSSSRKATIFLAVYNAENKLVDVNFQEYTLLKESKTIDVSIPSGAYNNCRVKAFVWDDLNSLQPLAASATLQ